MEHNHPAHFHGSARGNSWSQPWELTRLEVVVDDGRVNLVEVLESVDNLHDDGAALLLGHQLILFQVEIQIVAFAVLQHSAEAAKCGRKRKRQSVRNTSWVSAAYFLLG